MTNQESSTVSELDPVPTPVARARLVVLVLTALMIVFAITAAGLLDRALHQAAQARLQAFVHAHSLAIEARLGAIGAELRGLRGLFRGSELVTRDEFAAYVEASELFHHFTDIEAAVLLRGDSASPADRIDAIVRDGIAPAVAATVPAPSVAAAATRSTPVTSALEPDGRFWFLIGMHDPRLPGLTLGLRCTITPMFEQGKVRVADSYQIHVIDQGTPFTITVPGAAPAANALIQEATDRISFPDRELDIVLHIGTEWRSSFERALPWTTGTAVSALAILAGLLGWHLVGSRQRALLLAAGMTAELRQREAESREALHQLRELEALRDRLTSMIVHDMRSPLMGLHGYIELARMQPDRSDVFLGKAQSQSLVLTSMVDNLLDLRRLEERSMPMQPEDLEAREVTETALNRLGALIAERDIRLRIPHDLTVHADPHLLIRILSNLVANSAKFGESGSSISISGRRIDHGTRIEVRDTGPGIPEAEHTSIFEAWIQGRGNQRHAGGNGLGLAFCRLAVEAHHGQIGVEANHPHGCCFWFTLPDGEAPDHSARSALAG